MPRKITIKTLGQRSKTVTVPEDAKVKEILEKADIELEDDTTMIANGVYLKPNSTMGKHNEILLIPIVEGGC